MYFSAALDTYTLFHLKRMCIQYSINDHRKVLFRTQKHIWFNDLVTENKIRNKIISQRQEHKANCVSDISAAMRVWAENYFFRLNKVAKKYIFFFNKR